MLQTDIALCHIVYGLSVSLGPPPDFEALVVAVLGGEAVAGVRPHHALAARVPPHVARAGVHVTVAAAHGPVPLGPGAGGGAAGGRVLGAVGAAAVVGELHPLAAVLDHEVAEVDVGAAVVTAHLCQHCHYYR